MEVNEMITKLLEEKRNFQNKFNEFLRSGGNQKLLPSDYETGELQNVARKINDWFSSNFASAFHIYPENIKRPLICAMLDLQTTFDTMFIRELDNIEVQQDKHGHPYVRVSVRKKKEK